MVKVPVEVLGYVSHGEAPRASSALVGLAEVGAKVASKGSR